MHVFIFCLLLMINILGSVLAPSGVTKKQDYPIESLESIGRGNKLFSWEDMEKWLFQSLRKAKVSLLKVLYSSFLNWYNSL